MRIKLFHERLIRIFFFLGLIFFAAATGCIVDVSKRVLDPPRDAVSDEPADDLTEDWTIHDPIEALPDLVDTTPDAIDPYVEGECATCESLGVECGPLLDGCGHMLNCGDCPMAGEVCNFGVCECESDLTRCGDFCVDLLENRNHCGECYNECPAGWFCYNGICEESV